MNMMVLCKIRACFGGLFLIYVVYRYKLKAVYSNKPERRSIRETLSPKRTGVIIVAYFVAMCMTSMEMMTEGYRYFRFAIIMRLLIPYILGTVSSYLYFMRNKNSIVFRILYMQYRQLRYLLYYIQITRI